jgi:hypothetical protein
LSLSARCPLFAHDVLLGHDDDAALFREFGELGYVGLQFHAILGHGLKVDARVAWGHFGAFLDRADQAFVGYGYPVGRA